MTPQKKPVNSEHCRQMLVRDGERRFREWHAAFLKYQQEFLKRLPRSRSK
ncbi:MAG: hypothetical protein ACFE0I_09010 [Elainellaceae cyanobacterium]